MGRTILIEEGIRSELSKLLTSQNVTIGLLIGQVTEQKDYIALAVPTPSLKEDSNGHETSQKELFQHWWVVEHAKQVTRLLPGGLEVVGVLLCCQSELLKTTQPQLSSVLKEICSRKDFPIPLDPLHPHSHRALLHCCTKTKKQKCQTIDLTDSQAGFRPAELKFQAHSIKWHRIECPLTLHTEVCIPASPTTRKQVQQSIQCGLNEMLALVSGAVVSVRGRVVEGGAPLVKGGGLKKLQQSSSTGETISMEMFVRKPHSRPSEASPKTIEDCRELRLDGSMQCFAYVHPKATFGEATTAVKQDAARSLQARFSVLCEDATRSMDEDENATSTQLKKRVEDILSVFESCQLPRRLELVLSTSPLHLCDYCLPREEPQDCLAGVRELIGVEPEGITVRPIEKFPDPKAAASDIVKAQRPHFPMLGAAVAVTVALLAVILWALL